MMYRIFSRKTKRSRGKTEYFDNFALALSRVSVLRHQKYVEIVLSEMITNNTKTLVHFSLEDVLKSSIDLLGITSESITEEDVVTAFRNKAKEVHPDVGGDPDTYISVVTAKDSLLKIIWRSGPIAND